MVLAILAAGCQAETGADDGTGGGTAGAPAVPPRDAFALRFGDVTGQTRWGAAGPSSRRDAVVLVFNANAGVTCADPDAIPYPEHHCEKRQQIELFIPPELLHPGRIRLDDDRIGSSMWSNETSCAATIGPVLTRPGDTLEILKVSPDSIEANLELGPNPLVDELAGHYLATAGCGELPPEPVPTAGVAILGANLPARAVQGEVDPTALYVFAGTEPSTCEDPASTFDCSGTFRTVFAIPAGEIVPGDRELTDLGASYVAAFDGCSLESDKSGALRGGTVSITSADPTQISFQISGTFDRGAFGKSSLDGVFKATVCP